MQLGKLNNEILSRYNELIERHDLTIEEVIKSSACVTAELMKQVGAESIEFDEEILILTNNLSMQEEKRNELHV